MKFLKSEETMSPSSAENQKDHISSLPGKVIQEIFLRLSMEDAARTSCLSKTWKQYWDSFPCYLHFDQNPSSGLVPYQQFKSSIDRTLWTYLLKQLSILKFKLCMSTANEESVRDINRWVSTVMERGVKEIDLQLNLPCLYTLPQNLEGLTVLKLKSIKLSLCNGKINLSQLKTLSLESLILAEESVIDQLLTCCSSSMMELRILKCYGLKNLKISDLPQLKVIKIESFRLITSVVIQVPGLEKLVICEQDENFAYDKEFLMNLEIDSRTCETLRELAICHSNTMSRTFNSLVSRCSNLESLVIEDCKNIVIIKISSQMLRSLVIRRCIRVIFFDIVAPNLTSFQYLTSQYPNNSMDIISHLQEYLLDHSDLHLGTKGLSASSFKELKMFENKFHKAKCQKLVIFPARVGLHFDAMILEDWSSMPIFLSETVKSVAPKRIIVTNISFTYLLDYMFGSKNRYSFRKLLTISSNSESEVYELFKDKPNYSFDCCSSIDLSKAEAYKSMSSNGYGSLYKVFLAAGMTSTLKATLLFVK